MSLDLMLTFGAAAVELGIPVACILALAMCPGWRPALAVVIGAATPWVIVYVAVVVTWVAVPSKENLWVVLAMWPMSFAFYVCSVGAAGLLASLPRPRRLIWRAAMGAAPGLAVVAVASLSTFGRW